MIDIIDLSVQFGGKYLFENVNLKINPADKICLVGKNGSGKSTLLKLICGFEEPDSGKIQIKKNLSIGYLPQEFIKLKNENLIHEIRKSIPEITELQDEENKLHSMLENISADESQKQKIVERLGELNHIKEDLDYYRLDSRIEKILIGLGFEVTDFTRSVEEFSVGWQMRIHLAKLLLSKNDILLLDEPTNHLDLDSLRWLTQFLNTQNSALIIISHDNYFINKTTNKTIEIFNGSVSFYNGNYSSFLDYKEQRDRQVLLSAENQKKKIKEIERFIERFRYKDSKAKQVQSRIKHLQKMETFNIPESESSISVRFPEPDKSGVIPIELHRVSKSFNSKILFDNLNLQINRGDKIVFVGPNGAGKTTLSKIIANKLLPDSGRVEIGNKTVISYYAQEVAEELNADNDILEAVMEVTDDKMPGELRALLGSFLFSGDDVFKKIKVLSGGEKSRVALAKILLTKANVIILDEPTNHLDISSKEVLQNALSNYKGTLIIVTHDIDFIKPIANKTLEIKNGKVKFFSGGIEYYLDKIESDKNSGYKNREIPEKNISLKKEKKRTEAKLRQHKFDATKHLVEEIRNCEIKIDTLEKLKTKLDEKLSNPDIFSKPNEAKEVNLDYADVKEKLKASYNKWTELSEKLESIESYYSRLLE